MDRQQQTDRACQLGRLGNPPGSLMQGFTNQAQMTSLKVAQAAMQQLG